MNRHLATTLTPPLLPLLLLQGYWLRRTTPRLPDAAGPLQGNIPGAGEPLRLIALGESTVAGVGARTHETGLAGQLGLALSQYAGRSVEWAVVARSGINARQCRTELVPRLADQRADVVMIALGVNDAIEFHTARRWAMDMKGLIEDVRSQVGDPLVLLSGVPPLNQFPALPQPLSFVLGARSAALERASLKMVKKLKRVVYVPFRIERENAGDLFCADGFHPSEFGYSEWAEQLAAAFVRRPNLLDSRGMPRI
ncbi:MAG: SGNH/GDSL hydrolase family protein [Acidobacteriota bacterium]